MRSLALAEVRPFLPDKRTRGPTDGRESALLNSIIILIFNI